MDSQVVEARVKARQRARVVLSLAREEAGQLQTDAELNAFWHEVRREALGYLGTQEKPTDSGTRAAGHASRPNGPRECRDAPAESDKPMTDQEARAFERATIQFGKHEGRTIGDVSAIDPQYLVWLADRRDDFQRQLKRWLANPNVAKDVNPNPD